MKAIVVEEFGGPEVLRVAELPDPQAGPGQVRVAVHAAGINPMDGGSRADGSWAGLRVPCVLGYDIAGVGVYPPERAADAHRRLDTGHSGGKLVIQFRDEA